MYAAGHCSPANYWKPAGVTRGKIDHAEEDRVFAEDMATARQIIAQGDLVEAANQSARRENIDLKGEHHELF